MRHEAMRNERVVRRMTISNAGDDEFAIVASSPWRYPFSNCCSRKRRIVRCAGSSVPRILQGNGRVVAESCFHFFNAAVQFRITVIGGASGGSSRYPISSSGLRKRGHKYFSIRTPLDAARHHVSTERRHRERAGLIGGHREYALPVLCAL